MIENHYIEAHRELTEKVVYYRSDVHNSLADDDDEGRLRAKRLGDAFEVFADMIHKMEGGNVPITSINNGQPIPFGATDVPFTADEDPSAQPGVNLEESPGGRSEDFPIKDVVDEGGGNFSGKIDHTPTKIKPTGAGNPQNASFTVPTEHVGNFPGIRHYQGLGIRHLINGNLKNYPEPGAMQQRYHQDVEPVIQGAPNAFDDYVYPIQALLIKWKDCLVDSRIPMSVAEMADHTHSNYRWNHPQLDGFSDMLNDPLVTQGRLKIRVEVAWSFTATTDCLPRIARNSSGDPNTYDFGFRFDGATSGGAWVYRMDLAESEALNTAFMTAFVKRFGNEPGICQIIASESFTGSVLPPGFSVQQHMRGQLNALQAMVNAAPRDANGRRVNIGKTSPFDNGVSIQEWEDVGAGQCWPDIETFEGTCGDSNPADQSCLVEPNARNFSARMERHLNAGLPVDVSIDSKNAEKGVNQRGQPDPAIIPNPYGLAAGDRRPWNVRDMVWYFNTIVPVSSFCTNIGFSSVTNGTWDMPSIIETYRDWGQGGQYADMFGPFPQRIING